MLHRFSLAVALVALALSACGESHTMGGDAGTDAPGIVFDLDGAMFDSGVDAPVAPVTIGEACAAAADCGGDDAVCLTMPEQLIPGGYCSQICDPDGADPMCPTGSTCVGFGGGQAYCFRDCDASATTRACPRENYGCATSPMLPAVCVAGCFDSSDCPTDLDCDPTGGFYGAGTCFDPSAMPGDPCTDDSQCGAGGFCFTETGSGVVAGACFAEGCTIATNDGCTGSCFSGAGTSLCGAACTTTADCRDGFTCDPVAGATPARSYCAPNCTSDDQCTVGGFVCNEGTGTCAAPFDPTRLGGTCSTRPGGMACTGGTCISERISGFPGSYCAYAGCATPGTACDAETGGICAADPVGSGTNYCFSPCTLDTDCRAGYACRPSDPADATSMGACWPACVDSTVCSAMAGRTCNVTTGLCE